jgi:carbonic anhydrase
MATPETALKKLKDGNARFAADKLTAKDIGAKRRAELAKGQHPLAVVLTCSDSRLSPELIFDQGLGDVFVVRVAGNVAEPYVIASIEYAVEHLHAPLVVVMGHEKCGAVGVALGGEEVHGISGLLIKEIQIGKDLPKDKAEALTAAAKANTLHQTAQLTRISATLKDFATNQRIRVMPAHFSLASGEVQWLEADKKK